MSGWAERNIANAIFLSTYSRHLSGRYFPQVLPSLEGPEQVPGQKAIFHSNTRQEQVCGAYLQWITDEMEGAAQGMLRQLLYYK